MSEWTQYRRSAIAEMRPWTSGDDMTGVSVSGPDAAMGSPLHGDMIARNPKNHADQWLVAAAYFADNFLPMAPPEDNYTCRPEELAARWKSRWMSEHAALTEARRVLGRIKWVRIGGKMQPYCPFCWEQAKDGHAADCALAAVLAQEEPS